MSKEGKSALVPRLRFPEFRGGVGWKSKKLKALTSVITKGTTPTSLGYQFIESGINFIKIESISEEGSIDLSKVAAISEECNEALKRSQLEENDILFSIAGALGVIAVVKSDALPANTNQALAIVRLNEKDSLGFISAFLRSENVQSEISKIKAGAAQPNISLGQLGDFDVLMPEVKEQQKIADCLSSLDELITAETQKLDALKTHKKGLMQQLFPREGETHPDRRFSNESDWTVASLPDVVFFQEGPGIMAVDFCSEGVPLVRLAGVAGAAVTLDGCNYLDPKKVAQKWAHFRLALNDLVISTSATFGLSSIVTEAASGAIFYTGLIRFRPSNERLSLGYLKTFLGSPHFARQAESAAVGGGIKHFGPTHLKEMEIPIPPLAEQQRIADCLASLDELIAAQSQKIDALKAHKKGLMQQLFPVFDEVTT